MCYAENHLDSTDRRVSLHSIVRKVYPKEIAERVILGMCKLSVLRSNQSTNGDLIGNSIHTEEEIFSEDLGL